MTPALRWAAMTAMQFQCFVECEGQNHKTVNKPQLLKERVEPKSSGIEPRSFGYQPYALPLGHTGCRSSSCVAVAVFGRCKGVTVMSVVMNEPAPTAIPKYSGAFICSPFFFLFSNLIFSLFFLFFLCLLLLPVVLQYSSFDCSSSFCP